MAGYLNIMFYVVSPAIQAPDIGGRGNFSRKLPLFQIEPVQSNGRSVFETNDPAQTTSQAGNEAILETMQQGEDMQTAMESNSL